jgi:hypothetical protein
MEADTKRFIKDTLEAILGYVTPEGVMEPYEHAAEIVGPKHGMTAEQCRWTLHPFHWYLFLEKKFLTMEQVAGGYQYKRNVADPDLDKMTEEFFQKYGTLAKEKIANAKAGKYS